VRHTEPERGNGRLGNFLGALLDLLFRLASAGFLVLDELGVAPSLLEGLGLGAKESALESVVFCDSIASFRTHHCDCVCGSVVCCC
jgi:hypothetical protein